MIRAMLGVVISVLSACSGQGVAEAFCTLRIEPTWMTTGQSAGTAAALAARTGRIVQDLDVKKLQKRLRTIGQILDCRESRQSSAGLNPATGTVDGD